MPSAISPQPPRTCRIHRATLATATGERRTTRAPADAFPKKSNNTPQAVNCVIRKPIRFYVRPKEAVRSFGRTMETPSAVENKRGAKRGPLLRSGLGPSLARTCPCPSKPRPVPVASRITLPDYSVIRTLRARFPLRAHFRTNQYRCDVACSNPAPKSLVNTDRDIGIREHIIKIQV
jgi:hypothetical protein